MSTPSGVLVLLNSPARQPAVDYLICLVIAINDIFNISIEDLYNIRPHFLICIARMLSKKVRTVFFYLLMCSCSRPSPVLLLPKVGRLPAFHFCSYTQNSSLHMTTLVLFLLLPVHLFASSFRHTLRLLLLPCSS